MKKKSNPKYRDLLNAIVDYGAANIVVKNSENKVCHNVKKIAIAKADYLWDGDDDISAVHTRTTWRKIGYTKNEISAMGIAIPKGSIILEF